MLKRKQYSYIVYTSDEGRWTAHDVAKTEQAALSNAENLLGSNQYDAVKVVAEDGSGREKVIFEKKGTRKEKPVTIAALDAAPVCTDIEDFYRFPARRAMGQLLRRYLDKDGITALEILHNQRHMKTLMRKDPLYNQALGRVAGLHATATGKPQMECYEFLERSAKKIANRCHEQKVSEALGVLLSEKGFAAVAAKASDGDSYKEPYLFRTALAARLGTCAGWGSRIESAIELLAKPENKSGSGIIDDAIAEILDGAEAIKEILGHQDDLAAALKTLGELSRGRYEVPKTAPEHVEILNNAILKHRLPNSRQVLLERMERELAGIKGLTRDPRRQEEAYIEILRSLIVPLGLRGGGGMSASVVQRARLVFQAKGAGTLDKATLKVVDLIPVPLSKVGFLLALMSTDLEEKVRPVVEAALETILKTMVTLKDALPGAKMSPPLKAAIEELATRARRTEMDDLIRTRLADTLEGMVIDRGPKEVDEQEVQDAMSPATPPPEPERPVEAEVLPPVLCDRGLEYLTFEQGATLFKQGDTGTKAYYLVNGLAALMAGRDANNRSMETINPENLVGGEVLTGRATYKTTVQALTDVEAFVVPKRLVEGKVEALEQSDPLIHFVLTSVGKI